MRYDYIHSITEALHPFNNTKEAMKPTFRMDM